MRSVAPSSVFATLAAGWYDAFEWWADGVIPAWLWAVLAAIGFVAMPSRSARVRWVFPFATVLTLNIVQKVTPPPRIYMHLAPWLFAAGAVGLLTLHSRLRKGMQPLGVAASLVVLVAGAVYAASRPVLFHAQERADFLSVPEAINAVQESLSERREERAVLLAPLPCDLPSIFYLRRAGIELPVNARPQPGDRVYLIARPHETPEQVLATPLLDMTDIALQFSEWHRIATFKTLMLSTATMSSNIQREGTANQR
ncbi:MAG: hypothetical protein U0992_21150 [Planctomycetaceae bacterium]